jgi:hypothetical protein
MKTSECERAGLDSVETAERRVLGRRLHRVMPNLARASVAQAGWMSIKSHATPSFGSRASEES